VRCAYCKVLACVSGSKNFPKNCPMSNFADVLERARNEYQRDEKVKKIASIAGIVEASGYIEWPRLREIIEFARLIDARKIGLAFCIGLRDEAAVVSQILERAGFEVYSVNCKVGSIPKEELGIPKDYQWVSKTGYVIGFVTCNPIGQAMLLNAYGTDLNVMLGLCVGHDTLFIKFSEAPVTVLAAKDRAFGHSPLLAIYTYYGKKYLEKYLEEKRER